MEIASALLSMAPTEPRGPSAVLSPLLPKAASALEHVVRRFPGLVEAQLLLARARYLAGEHDAAGRAVKAVLDLQPNKAEALLLQAQLHLAKGNARMAMDHLEQAVSASFAIRETPGFNQAKAQSLLAMNENTSAVKRARSASLAACVCFGRLA